MTIHTCIPVLLQVIVLQWFLRAEQAVNRHLPEGLQPSSAVPHARE